MPPSIFLNLTILLEPTDRSHMKVTEFNYGGFKVTGKINCLTGRRGYPAALFDWLGNRVGEVFRRQPCEMSVLLTSWPPSFIARAGPRFRGVAVPQGVCSWGVAVGARGWGAYLIADEVRMIGPTY